MPPRRALFFSTFAAYIENAGSAAPGAATEARRRRRFAGISGTDANLC
jgi:hypothetical protein